jgi:truncated hemoglobin YjbI
MLDAFQAWLDASMERHCKKLVEYMVDVHRGPKIKKGRHNGRPLSDALCGHDTS